MLRKARALPALLVFLVLFIASPSNAIIVFPEEIGLMAAGSAPGAVAVHPILPLVYVANTGDGTLTTLNSFTGDEVNTVSTLGGLAPPGGAAPHGIAVNPILNRVYVANGESNFVSIHSAFTGDVIQAPINIPNCRVGGGTGPWGIAAHPITGLVYVACESGRTLWAINGITGVGTRSLVTPGFAPLGVALNPLTNLVYVGYAGSHWIDVFDGATLARVSRIGSLTGGSWGVAVDPITSRVAVANLLDGSLSIFAGGRLLCRTDMARPEWIAFDSIRNRVWVPENTADRVTAVDALTCATVEVAISGSRPTAVAVEPVTGIAYSSNFGSADVSQIF
jgi:DNA-binding beta-propeller fold protein YncE